MATKEEEVAPPAEEAPSTEEDEAARKSAAIVKNLVKLTGIKASEVLAVNPQTNTAVTENGQKFVLNKKGDKVRLLQGPQPPKNAEDDRDQGSRLGTAAEIAAPVPEGATLDGEPVED